MNALPMQVIAACFSLSAFAVAILAGLAASNDASTVLQRAIFAMIVCYPAGWIGGLICQRAIERHMRERTRNGADMPTGVPPDNAAAPEEDEEVLVV